MGKFKAGQLVAASVNGVDWITGVCLRFVENRKGGFCNFIKWYDDEYGDFREDKFSYVEEIYKKFIVSLSDDQIFKNCGYCLDKQVFIPGQLVAASTDDFDWFTGVLLNKHEDKNEYVVEYYDCYKSEYVKRKVYYIDSVLNRFMV